jgi:hypothetical protein
MQEVTCLGCRLLPLLEWSEWSSGVGSTTAQGIDSFSFRQGTKLEFDRGREKRRGCARPVHTCAGVVVEGCCLVGGVNAGTWAAALMQSLGRRRAPAGPRAGRRRSSRWRRAPQGGGAPAGTWAAARSCRR